MSRFTIQSSAVARYCEKWWMPAIADAKAGEDFTLIQICRLVRPPSRRNFVKIPENQPFLRFPILFGIALLMTNNDLTQTKDQIRTFINNSINIDSIGDDENLFETGLINSLFAVQLMTFVERTFGIEIGVDDLDIENFKSISATAAFVTRKSFQ